MQDTNDETQKERDNFAAINEEITMRETIKARKGVREVN